MQFGLSRVKGKGVKLWSHMVLLSLKVWVCCVSELEQFRMNGGDPPQCSFTLCFGEELGEREDPANKLIIAQVCVNLTTSCSAPYPTNTTTRDTDYRRERQPETGREREKQAGSKRLEERERQYNAGISVFVLWLISNTDLSLSLSLPSDLCAVGRAAGPERSVSAGVHQPPSVSGQSVSSGWDHPEPGVCPPLWDVRTQTKAIS